MKLLAGIIKWIIISTGVLIIVLFSLSIALSRKIGDIFLKSINERLTTKIEIGNIDLSLIRRFPRASVILTDVTVYSSPGFNRKDFKGINTDTLLTSKGIILEFNALDLIRKNFTIGRISADKGKLNLFTDRTGNINYDFYKETVGGTGNDSLAVSLEKVTVSGFEVSYVNRATSISVSGTILNARLKSSITADLTDLDCNTSLVLNSADAFNTTLKTNSDLYIDINLQQSKAGLQVNRGIMKLESFRFEVSGSVKPESGADLLISGENIDLSEIRKFMTPELREKYNEYSPSGILDTRAVIRGKITRKATPEINVSFSVRNGAVKHKKSDVSVDSLSLSGSFTNGALRDATTSKISLDRFSFDIGSARWSGRVSLLNFSDPYAEMAFSGDILPGELLRFLPAENIISAGGSARLNLKISGNLPVRRKIEAEDILKMSPEADIQFHSFFVDHARKIYSVNDADGNIMLAKNLWAEELYFTWEGTRFRINGEFANLPAWLAGRRVKLRIDSDIHASNFNPLMFFSDKASSDTSGPGKIEFPSDIQAKINFTSDNFSWKSFSADKITARINYRNGLLDVNDMSVSAIGGTTRGDFFVVQNRQGSFISHGKFTFDGIDINGAFRAFENFGQDFIVAENLAGTLSGSLSVMIPFDSLFNADAGTLTAEGKYVIDNGALKDFEPVKELSGFIELSELENISFSRLENDLFIRNNYVAIPQMDIKSSAADFSINGKHYFDYNYEYHVKVYLSELLSRKAKRNDRYESEFGPVEEDGLGRTSIFLKITGNDETTKVSPDLKAAGGNIKQNLNKEKNTLRNILNEEYGWFKKDTAVNRTTSSRPRFRIEFSETDTITAVKDSTAINEKSGLSRIFRKKKGLD